MKIPSITKNEYWKVLKSKQTAKFQMQKISFKYFT